MHRTSLHRSIAITLLASVIGVAAGLGAYTFIYAKGYSYLTNNPAACANCHVIEAQCDAWTKSSHHSVATCNDCHTPHNLIGKYAVKANNGSGIRFTSRADAIPTPSRSPGLITGWLKARAGGAMNRSFLRSTAT